MARSFGLGMHSDVEAELAAAWGQDAVDWWLHNTAVNIARLMPQLAIDEVETGFTPDGYRFVFPEHPDVGYVHWNDMVDDDTPLLVFYVDARAAIAHVRLPEHVMEQSLRAARKGGC